MEAENLLFCVMEEGGRWVFPFVMSSEPSLAHGPSGQEHVGLSQTMELQELHTRRKGSQRACRSVMSLISRKCLFPFPNCMAYSEFCKNNILPLLQFSYFLSQHAQCWKWPSVCFLLSQNRGEDSDSTSQMATSPLSLLERFFNTKTSPPQVWLVDFWQRSKLLWQVIFLPKQTSFLHPPEHTFSLNQASACGSTELRVTQHHRATQALKSAPHIFCDAENVTMNSAGNQPVWGWRRKPGEGWLFSKLPDGGAAFCDQSAHSERK